MNNKELVQKLKDIALNYKTLYVLGCFGAPMTDANKTRYCNNLEYNKQAARSKMIRAASADTFGFDCVCLIKGVLWGWKGDKNSSYGGAKYNSNGVPDIDEGTMIARCSEVSTDFTKITEGEVVWMKGHIGVYIGDGLAVECTPKWGNNVQITACNCDKSGYNRRDWTKHGKLPYITYIKEEVKVEEPKKEATTPITFKVGDIVEFRGNVHYGSANSTNKVTCKPGKAKITNVYMNGKHQYHLIRIQGGTSTVYGWVDGADITPLEETFNVGDTVFYTGTVHYNSANAANSSVCMGGKAKITQIYQLGKSKHPYHLVRVSGSGASVYGWVDEGTFTKI